jgi:hypothetical protein
MTGDPDTVVAVWVESTGCGTRFETLTAAGTSDTRRDLSTTLPGVATDQANVANQSSR